LTAAVVAAGRPVTATLRRFTHEPALSSSTATFPSRTAKLKDVIAKNGDFGAVPRKSSAKLVKLWHDDPV